MQVESRGHDQEYFPRYDGTIMIVLLHWMVYANMYVIDVDVWDEA